MTETKKQPATKKAPAKSKTPQKKAADPYVKGTKRLKKGWKYPGGGKPPVRVSRKKAPKKAGPAKKKAGPAKSSSKKSKTSLRAAEKLEKHDVISRRIDELNAELTEAQRDAARQLTSNEVVFANHVLNGMALFAAYYDAFPETTANHESVKVMASRLRNDSRIVLYMEACKAATVLASAYDRQWKRNALIETAERSMQTRKLIIDGKHIPGFFTFNANGAIRAIHELNLMDGDLVEAKSQEESQGERLRRLMQQEQALKEQPADKPTTH